MKKKGIFTGCFIVLALLLSSAAYSGSLDSTAAPGTPNSYRLEDIYNRLSKGTAGAQSGFTDPAAGPTAGTGYTLDQIMGIAPSPDNTNGAGTADVLSGKTFWGLTGGAWGPRVGTRAPAPVAVNWPNPRFTVNENGTPADQTDDTVTDNLTGLMWTRNADIAGAKNWGDAKTYCDGLTLGGNSDWRLPTGNELASLVHLGYYGPPVPNTAGTGQWTEGDPFNNVRKLQLKYWSATACADGTITAWVVGMFYGDMNIDYKTAIHYVWPVR